MKWLGLGSLLALAPALSTAPSLRLLSLPSLGAAVVVAVILVQFARMTTERLAARAVVVGILLVHGVLALVTWPGTVALLRATGETSVQRVMTRTYDRGRPLQILIATEDPVTAYYTPAILAFHGGATAAPEVWAVLSMAPFDHRLTRTGPSTVELEVVEGRMLDSMFEKLVRTERRAFAVGDEVRTAAFRVRILAADGPYPSRIGVTFDVPLESDRLELIWWHDGALRTLPPLRVGESVLIPRQPPFA